MKHKNRIVKNTLFISAITIYLTACNQKGSTNDSSNISDTLHTRQLNDSAQQGQISKMLVFKSVSEIVADSSCSTWVMFKDSTSSLALHFQYKDTLAVSYSPECWLMYPYKLDGNKIVVYWDNNIDTKYDFDIVKAVNNTDKRYIGKPFMILELKNDTTLRATYPLKDLILKLNNSSKERTFFPDTYIIAQDGYL